jgi:DNA-binding response OmpR family regulator
MRRESTACSLEPKVRVSLTVGELEQQLILDSFAPPDYLAKPFSAKELIARSRTLLSFPFLRERNVHRADAPTFFRLIQTFR